MYFSVAYNSRRAFLRSFLQVRALITTTPPHQLSQKDQMLIQTTEKGFSSKFLRSLKVQIYDTWSRDNAGCLLSQSTLFTADSKKLTQAVFTRKMFRCKERRALNLLFYPGKGFGEDKTYWISNLYLCKPHWLIWEWCLLSRELESCTSCSTLCSSKNCRRSEL